MPTRCTTGQGCLYVILGMCTYVFGAFVVVYSVCRQRALPCCVLCTAADSPSVLTPVWRGSTAAALSLYQYGRCVGTLHVSGCPCWCQHQRWGVATEGSNYQLLALDQWHWCPAAARRVPTCKVSKPVKAPAAVGYRICHVAV
jgi:hypothetical protein